MKSHMEAYFNDQKLRQANKTQRNIRIMSNDVPSISINEPKKALGAKKRNLRERTEYYKAYKRKCRQNQAFKTKEREAIRSVRKDTVYKTKEREAKQSVRKDPLYKTKKKREAKQSVRKYPLYKTKERGAKQSVRKDPVYKMKEKEVKQSVRKDPIYKTKERQAKQFVRKDPVYKMKEKEAKQSVRKDHVYKTKERQAKQSVKKHPVYKTKERQAKQFVRKDPVHKSKEREAMRSVRKDPAYKTKERQAKQFVRKDPVYKSKEREAKQSARENQTYKAQEKLNQKMSKRKARENPYVLECERIKKQQIRQEKRKFNDNSEIDVPRKRRKHDMDILPKNCRLDFVTTEESIKQFHSDISIGPLYVCTCCHQIWFRKSVSILKNMHIPAESRRQYCTGFTSVNNEEWACHTCLSALRERKCPKLSVANGMKWPDKPVELNLHQLEERLIALRIQFMQIRELPRGGQYSLKGNVINVPVDIQPTINCLPRPMDENFTVAIQLKKKLSYKKVDFKENVRPLRVLSALHWLMNNSELYKKYGIVVDDNWFQEVTESAEEESENFWKCQKNNVRKK